MALDQVYGISARLDEAKDVSAFPSDFENILQFTKPTNKDNASRKLAITFIPRYIKHFESQQNAAVDVLIDLCEDDAQDVRLVSIRSFASVCKDVPKSLLSVADVLAQLLATESSAELEQVTKTLEELVRLSAKDVVSVLVTQVLTRPEKQQKRALEFLNSKIFENKDISPSIRESGDEGQLAIAQSLVKLIDVAENGLIEFEKIKKWISSLGTLKKEKNASQFTNSLQQLVNFDETKIEAAQISKLFLVMSLISKYQKVRVDSKATTTTSTTTTTEGQAQQPQQQQDNKLLNFIAFKLLPQFEKVDEKFRLMMLQTIADNISKFSSENLVSLLDSVFQIATKFYLPDESQSTKPKLNFSFVEAILVILYSIAKNNTMAFRQYFGYKRPFTGQPSDFQPLPADQQKKQASFQKSLTWLSEQSQTYLKDLKEALPNITESSAKTVALTAQRTTETIHSIASDLRKENPSFSATPQVSWKRSFDNSDKKRKQKEQQKTDQKSTTTSNTSNTQSHPSKKQKTNNNNNNGNNGNNQQKQQNQQQRPRQNNNNNNNNSNQQNRKQGGGNRNNNNNNGNGNNQQRRNNNNNNNNNSNNNNGGSGRIPSLYDNNSSGKRKFGQF